MGSNTASWPPMQRDWTSCAEQNDISKKTHAIDAETTPLESNPDHYKYDINLPDVAKSPGGAAAT